MGPFCVISLTWRSKFYKLIVFHFYQMSLNKQCHKILGKVNACLFGNNLSYAEFLS